ncbi:MAG TPA: tripartite tricarboxylate transporter substrate binding protein [Burkholderiales bacterium]|nr:tripartite tricarboxylate transporter substrate binding protein [Burkholderiales bacterium]
MKGSASWICAVLLFAISNTALSQPYPAKPVRFILGPSSEVLPRIVAQKLSSMWGQQVLVDPRTGGGGIIAADIVSKSPPDGYTWLLSTATYTISASLLANPPFDLQRDFLAVTLLASAPFYMLVHPSLPAKSVKEFIALARARPGQLNYGSSGIGTPPHMAGEMFKNMAHVNLVHVPYKSAAGAVTDHIAGQVQVSFQYGPTSLPHVQSGKLRALAVTGTSRSRYAPQLPTMEEGGLPGYELIGWNGIHVPQRTPVEIINKLNTDLRQALQAADVQERLMAAGLDIHGSSRADFEAFVNKDRARWVQVVKDAGITPE